MTILNMFTRSSWPEGVTYNVTGADGGKCKGGADVVLLPAPIWGTAGEWVLYNKYEADTITSGDSPASSEQFFPETPAVAPELTTQVLSV